MIYRCALIGCGNIASLYAEDPLIQGVYTHAGAYATCSQTELIAVCDVDQAKAYSCAKKWNVRAIYTNVEELLVAEQPDMVSICTPDQTHADILECVLQHACVKAVLVEKPLALDVEKAEYLVKLAEEKKVVLLVNYSRRYDPIYTEVRSVIVSKKLGEIQTITGFYTKGILHNGTHWLDLARWFLGEVKNVQAWHSIQTVKMEDPSLDARLVFANGARGFLEGLDANAFSLFEMDIIGTAGRIKLKDSGHHIECYEVGPSPRYSGYQALLETQQHHDLLKNTLLNVVLNLVDCLNNDKQPVCSGVDGLAALRIAHSMIQSACKNENVELNECVFE